MREATASVALPAPRTATALRLGLRRQWFAERPLVTLGVLLVLLIVLLAVLAPLLPLRDPNVTAPARRLGAPGANAYLLGTNQLGRDLLSRLIWGARVSIVVASVAAAVAFVVGGGIGLVAGFYGGFLRRRLSCARWHSSKPHERSVPVMYGCCGARSCRTLPRRCSCS
jgi:peptide/nickel transport system permease protein